MKTLNDKLNKFRKKLWKKEPDCSFLIWVETNGTIKFTYVYKGVAGEFNLWVTDFDKFKIKELVQLVRTNTFQSI